MIHWLQNYFEDKSAAQPIIEKLERLQKIDIAPSLPNINTSLAEISKALSSMNVQSKPPTEQSKLPVIQKPKAEPQPKTLPKQEPSNPGVEI